jgi:hypothetical protein
LTSGEADHLTVLLDANVLYPDDRHVLAAAIVGRCDVIITNNLKDFPRDVLAADGLKAQNPDGFLANLYGQHPEAFRTAVRAIRMRLERPAYSAVQYLELLYRRGLIYTAEALSQDKSEL